jgi:hypothetical protein
LKKRTKKLSEIGIAHGGGKARGEAETLAKVFCFFFSKKKRFLA